MSRREHPSRQGDLVPAAEFSVRDYAATAWSSHRAELRLEVYQDQPLPPELVELTRTLSELERSSPTYLRRVLVTPAHQDARITAFLVTWAFEKHWIADALEVIADAHPYAAIPWHRGGVLRRVGAALRAQVEPVSDSVAANLAGEDAIAAYLLAAVVDGWLMDTVFTRLIETSGHAPFASTLERLVEVKKRHLVFFRAQTRDRLAGSAQAARIARRRMRTMAVPLGISPSLMEPVARLLAATVREDDLARIDGQLAELAWLGAPSVATRAVDRIRRVGGQRRRRGQ